MLGFRTGLCSYSIEAWVVRSHGHRGKPLPKTPELQVGQNQAFSSSELLSPT